MPHRTNCLGMSGAYIIVLFRHNHIAKNFYLS